MAPPTHNDCIMMPRYYFDKKQQPESEQGEDANGDGVAGKPKKPGTMNADELLKQAEDQAHVDEVTGLDWIDVN